MTFPCSECEHWFDQNIEKRQVGDVTLYICYHCMNFKNTTLFVDMATKYCSCPCGPYDRVCFSCQLLSNGGCHMVSGAVSSDIVTSE